MRWAKKALLAKIETSYGVDANPTGAANAMLARGVTLNPQEGEEIVRENVRPSLGGFEKLKTGTHVSIEFDIELAGAGTAGGIPAWGVLMRACGWAETNTPSVDTQYDPVSAGEESCTIYINIDGVLHKLTGCRGDWSLKLDAKGEALMHFKVLGMYNAPTDTALPTVDYSAFQRPVPATKATTPTFTLHGYAAVLQSLEINRGNKVAYRALINYEGVEILDRDFTGKAQIEAPSLAAKDFFSLSEAGTIGALQLVHGTAAGNIVQIDSSRVQLGRIGYAEADGVAVLDIPLGLPPTANPGDDELKITVK